MMCCVCDYTCAVSYGLIVFTCMQISLKHNHVITCKQQIEWTIWSSHLNFAYLCSLSDALEDTQLWCPIHATRLGRIGRHQTRNVAKAFDTLHTFYTRCDCVSVCVFVCIRRIVICVLLAMWMCKCTQNTRKKFEIPAMMILCVISRSPEHPDDRINAVFVGETLGSSLIRASCFDALCVARMNEWTQDFILLGWIVPVMPTIDQRLSVK